MFENLHVVQNQKYKLFLASSIIFTLNILMKDYRVAFEVNEQNVTASYILDSINKISDVHYHPNYCNRAKFENFLLKL